LCSSENGGHSEYLNQQQQVIVQGLTSWQKKIKIEVVI
jgi:hypothetical protein